MPSTSNNGPGLGPPHSILPPWLASSSTSPSVTLTLSPITGPPARTVSWLPDHNIFSSTTGTANNNSSPRVGGDRHPSNNGHVFQELAECCRELEEGHRAWDAHRKEAAWRLKRVELQLESEKAGRKREKTEEIEAKVRALRDEQKAVLERIEGEYREQLAGLRREAEMKEQKLAEQWGAKHLRLTKFLEQAGGCRPARGDQTNGR